MRKFQYVYIFFLYGLSLGGAVLTASSAAEEFFLGNSLPPPFAKNLGARGARSEKRLEYFAIR